MMPHVRRPLIAHIAARCFVPIVIATRCNIIHRTLRRRIVVVIGTACQNQWRRKRRKHKESLHGIPLLKTPTRICKNAFAISNTSTMKVLCASGEKALHLPSTTLVD